jgi:tubulin polyglutamylase TTLL9
MEDKKIRPNGPIKFRTTFRNAIYDALKSRGWKETEGDDWDLHWCEINWMATVFDTVHLNSWQRVNHFRNQREMCRKDLLVKNLKRHKRALQKEGSFEVAAQYDFWPTTYVLPGDYALFVEEFKRSNGR